MHVQEGQHCHCTNAAKDTRDTRFPAEHPNSNWHWALGVSKAGVRIGKNGSHVAIISFHHLRSGAPQGETQEKANRMNRLKADLQPQLECENLLQIPVELLDAVFTFVLPNAAATTRKLSWYMWLACSW